MIRDESLLVGRTLLVLRWVTSARWEGADRLVVASVGGRVEFFEGDSARRVWRALSDDRVAPAPVVPLPSR